MYRYFKVRKKILEQNKRKQPKHKRKKRLSVRGNKLSPLGCYLMLFFRSNGVPAHSTSGGNEVNSHDQSTELMP